MGEAKYQAIRDRLADDIAGGVYADGARLPTCRELAIIHDASYLTVNKAVRCLQDEGLARLIQGKGIFAIARKHRSGPKRTVDSRQVAFLMPVKGDLFQNFFSRIMTTLSAHGLSCLPLSGMTDAGTETQWERRAQFEKHVSPAMRTYIVDGLRHFQFKIFKEFHPRLRQTVFVFHFDSGIEFPDANFILNNFREGGHLAAKHLLARGRRRIALVTFETLPEEELSRRGAVPARGVAALTSGIKDSLGEHGLDPEANFAMVHQPPWERDQGKAEAKCLELFGAGIDGFVCHGDNRAVPIYRAAQKAGLAIGRDIGVVGYFNTPWCEMLTPNLSSVSIQEERIADLAAEAVMKDWKGQRTVVPPKLMIRDSA